MSLQDKLAQLGQKSDKGMYSGNIFANAPLLAQALVQFQKQQRAEPFTQALNQYSQQWQSAGTDAERQAANQQANLARATFLQKGGSPTDLPTNLWGSDPLAGFQTGAEHYSPLYAGDNLSFGQREKTEALERARESARQSALTNALNLRAGEASITGIDPYTGQNTWDRQYREQSLANDLYKATTGGDSGFTPWQEYQISQDEAELEAKIDAEARKALEIDTRKWTGPKQTELDKVLYGNGTRENPGRGSDTNSGLVRAYMSTPYNYDRTTAERVAMADERYTSLTQPPEGQWRESDLLEAHKERLRQLYNSAGGYWGSVDRGIANTGQPYKSQGRQLSQSFNESEFASRGNGNVYVEPDLLSKLEQLRAIAGPITINSGYRDPAYNKKIGGANESKHMYGQAADIVIPGMKPSEVAKLARQLGFGGVRAYDTFTHVDIGPARSW